MSCWGENELAILHEYYPVGGYFLCKEKGLKRSRDATLKKAQSLHIKVLNKSYRKSRQKINWSEWKEDLLIDMYEDLGSEGMIPFLNNRTKAAIYLKATSLNLKYKAPKSADSWSDKELDILHKYYEKYGALKCKEEGINRSQKAISRKALLMGLRMKEEYKVDLLARSVKETRVTYSIWSDKDLDILNKYYTIEGSKGCKERGIDKSSLAICQKARRLGLEYIGGKGNAKF